MQLTNSSFKVSQLVIVFSSLMTSIVWTASWTDCCHLLAPPGHLQLNQGHLVLLVHLVHQDHSDLLSLDHQDPLDSLAHLAH